MNPISRRNWLRIAAAGFPVAAAQGRKPYRAALIGQTGAGDYGHGWDAAWGGIAGVSVVAVADPDERGRRNAAARSGARGAYADYREMLQKEKPDIVALCSRSPAKRLETVRAAADAGAHMLIEKPLARDLIAADEIVRIAEQRRLKVQFGLVMRTQPAVLQAREMLARGEIGALQELRARGKEDKRAGGEDMAVLGPHLFDLMRMFAGDPKSVFAHVTTDGQEIDRTRVHQAADSVGPVAGNQIAAMFAFNNGVHGYFDSRSNPGPAASRFGLSIYGSKGAIFLGITKYPEQALVIHSPSWLPGAQGHAWQPIEVSDRTPLTRDSANVLLIRDLLGAMEEDRQPVCNAVDGRWTIEMLQGVYLSQLRGTRVAFPLKERRHPLEDL